MINLIRDAYNIDSLDVRGDFLVKPLRSYHGFFAKHLTNSSILGLIAHIAIGIFAYPIFCALASVGIPIKLIGQYYVVKHNNKEKARIEAIEIPEHSFHWSDWATKTTRLITRSPLELNKDAGDIVPGLESKGKSSQRECALLSDRPSQSSEQTYFDSKYGKIEIVQSQTATYSSHPKVKGQLIATIDRKTQEHKKVYVSIASDYHCRGNSCRFTIYTQTH